MRLNSIRNSHKKPYSKHITKKMKTGQGLQQTQQQKQVQTTSAAQVLLSNMIEMPLADFEQHITNELDDNEALEISTDDNDWDASATDNDSYSQEQGVRDSHTSQDDYDECLTIDQVPEDMRERYNQEMRTGNASRSQYDGDTERQIVDTGTTSYDDIISQIGENNLSEDEIKIMNYLVGSLDERGYLTKDNQTLIDELTFQEYIYTDEAQLQRLIELLQSFEPRGIGAHDLRECLLLQMQCEPAERARLPLVKRLAHKVVRDMFEELGAARWGKIQNALDVDDETIDEIRNVIRHLNPRPGSGLNESMQSSAPSIIADFRLIVDDNRNIIVVQERGNIPELRVSNSFTEILEEYHQAAERAKANGHELAISRAQHDAYDYANHKVEAAKAFIDNIRRRRFTLQTVMEGIAKHQRDFFINEDDETMIHPMVLRDIADYAGVDISTVSRAANSKYVQTEYGTYPLKYFFGTEFVNTEGDSVSQRLALKAIKEIIDDEDPHHPLSDQQITDLLAKSGTIIARRTVAKYRERLGYPTSHFRKR